MATIPVRTRRPATPAVAPIPLRQAGLDVDTGMGQALGDLGERTMGLSAAAENKQAKDDNLTASEAVNAMRAKHVPLYLKLKQERKGKAAEGLTKAFNNQMSQDISAATKGMTSRAKLLFQNAYSPIQTGYSGKAAEYEESEKNKRLVNNNIVAIAQAGSNAVLTKPGPSPGAGASKEAQAAYTKSEKVFKDNLKEIESRTRALYKTQGMDAEAISVKVQEAVSKVHVQVIKAYLGDKNTAQAQGYLKDLGSEDLTGTDRTHVTEIVQNKTDEQTAEDMVRALVAEEPDHQKRVAAIRKQTKGNKQLQNAAMTALENQTVEDDRAKARNQRDWVEEGTVLMSKVALDEVGAATELNSIANSYTGTTRLEMLKYAKALLSNKGVVTDPRAMYKLSSMSPQELAELGDNLINDYWNRLSPSDLEFFVQEQKKAKRGDMLPNIRTPRQMAIAAGEEVGVDFEMDESKAFMDYMTEEIKVKGEGGNLSPTETQDLMNNAAFKWKLQQAGERKDGSIFGYGADVSWKEVEGTEYRHDWLPDLDDEAKKRMKAEMRQDNPPWPSVAANSDMVRLYARMYYTDTMDVNKEGKIRMSANLGKMLAEASGVSVEDAQRMAGGN